MRTSIAALAMALSATALAAALAAALATASPSRAGSVSVRQAGPANVYGLVQAGPRPSTVDVEQRGAFNVLGVMQATPGAQLSAYQRGGDNVAIARQSGLGPLSRGVMP